MTMMNIDTYSLRVRVLELLLGLLFGRRLRSSLLQTRLRSLRVVRVHGRVSARGRERFAFWGHIFEYFDDQV
jgi:hypothetical protein